MSDAVQRGTPITWMFGIAILVIYLGSYIWSIQEQNARLTDVVQNQQEIISNQTKEIEQLQELIDTMFEYMGVKSQSPTYPYEDPIHRKPI